jgi:effector-binding domain-containing protein
LPASAAKADALARADDVQNTIQDIYHLKRNNYISDLHEGEIEELQYYKKLFEDIYKDFQELGI